MIVAIPSEKRENERRVPLLPEAVKTLLKAEGIEVLVEAGLSEFNSDEEYRSAGARLGTRTEVFQQADVLMRIHPSAVAEFQLMKKGSLHISLLDPYNNKDLVNQVSAAGIGLISMEMIPRTTIAQKMDVLSSQASIAGYQAVLLAAERSIKMLPMMMTPAGTISPARVFVIGAGVAGLQAIATAKRLGARVEAFDTRPVVEEQVRSLGAKFVKIDLGDTGQTEQGYAKALTAEQLQKQQELMAKVCIQSDVVITTAKLFGRRAPVLIRKETVSQMHPGAIIVDLAAGSGGNVEGVVCDQIVNENGVEIIGIDNLAGGAAFSASQMFGSNLVNLFKHFWNNDKLDLDIADNNDEILSGCLIAYQGRVCNQAIVDHYAKF